MVRVVDRTGGRTGDSPSDSVVVLSFLKGE
jgi:hypothetical protein